MFRNFQTFLTKAAYPMAALVLFWAVYESVESARAQAFEPQKATVEKYCQGCHNSRARIAGLALDQLNIGNPAADAEIWEKVIRKLRARDMPPAGVPRPDAGVLDNLIRHLETSLDRAPLNPGRVPLHRLSRVEYQNAVRDLLDLAIDVASLLPPDDVDQHGFENIAGVLSVSPALVEAYLSSAARISRMALGDSHAAPVFENYSVPASADQSDRMGEDLPFGSRGGLAVRHHFAADAQYEVRLRLRRELYDYILGLGHPQKLEVRVDGDRVKTFIVGGEEHGTPAPATFVGSLPGDAEWEEYLHSADNALLARFPAKAGMRTVSVSFVKEYFEPEGLVQPPNSTFGKSSDEQWEGLAAIDSVAVGGPFEIVGMSDTASRKRILLCSPAADQRTCARKILSTLARRAFRRPLTAADIQSLEKTYDAGASAGGFEEGIRLALQALLVDPDFLFKLESAPANTAAGATYRLNDLALASRLSFFLWNSIPDDQLLDVAAQGKLSQPETLKIQVRRMLADKRASSLAQHFAAQWLDLRKMKGVQPDPEIYPDFDDTLREAFQTETILFLESQIQEDHNVADLLDADYTFLNERLAQHYGIANVYGSHFRRAALKNEERGGLLGEGSILTLTSYPARTSPVLRGKWLLDNVFGMAPPPPPPDVPSLKETGENGKPTSVRERMEQHRKERACASCHALMDPLGFALENFDPIGRWRVASDGLPVDSVAALPDGTRMQGVKGLRQALRARAPQFVRTIIEKMLTYALGRELQAYDYPTVRQILRTSANGQDRWSAIVMAIATSAPFQMNVADKGTR